MKRVTEILLAVFLAAFTLSCDEEGTDAQVSLTGTWSGTVSCPEIGQSGSETVVITQQNTSCRECYVLTFVGGEDEISLDATLAGTTLDIKETILNEGGTVDVVRIKGTGTFENDELDITLTLVEETNSNFTYTCVFALIKQ